MDYRYIHPLFTETDIEDATEYMAKDMLNSGAVGAIGIDGFPTDLESAIGNEKLFMPVIKTVVGRMYGPNVINMANYTIVQNVYLNSYKESILRYLSDCHVKASCIEFTPSMVAGPILQKKGIQFADKIITQFHPEKEWDLNYKNPVTDSNVAYNLCNPLNGYMQSIICMTSLTNRPFIEYVTKSYNMAYSKDFEHAVNNGYPVTMNIAILPSKTYSNIIRFVQAIHRYF